MSSGLIITGAIALAINFLLIPVNISYLNKFKNLQTEALVIKNREPTLSILIFYIVQLFAIHKFIFMLHLHVFSYFVYNFVTSNK